MKKLLVYIFVAGLAMLAMACGSPPQPAGLAEKPAEKPEPIRPKLQGPDIALGDTWVFEVKRIGASVPYVKWSEKVTAINTDRIVCLHTDLSTRKQAEITYGPGWTPLSKNVRSPGMSNYVPKGKLPVSFPLWLGKRWKDSYAEELNGDAPRIMFRNQYTVVKQEKLQTPAGTFQTWRIQISQNWVERFYSEQWHQWYAPEVGRIVRISAPGHFAMQLVSFIPAR